jgi:hypothetical protein
VGLEGTLVAPGPVLPWPADPGKTLSLATRLRVAVTADSPEDDAEPQRIAYFQGSALGEGFVVADPASGPLLVGWSGRWTNRDGFLLEGAFAGQRVEGGAAPVVRLAGTAEVHGLSGRGRGLVLQGPWSGEWNVRTGELRLALTGPAAGELGPPPVICGEHTDPELAGDLQPLMLRADGSVNVSHFSYDENDPYPHPFPYSTNPPTSGPHAGRWVLEGVYTTPQNDEMLVHNLEHGHVLVLYHPSLPAAVVARLKAVVELYEADVVLAPRPANDVPIALSSWGRLQKFAEYDEPAIQNFIDRNRGHGPECFY